jgi:hypothetical protein
VLVWRPPPSISLHSQFTFVDDAIFTGPGVVPDSNFVEENWDEDGAAAVTAPAPARKVKRRVKPAAESKTEP